MSPGSALSAAERERLDAIRSAGSLAALRRVMGADSEHAAYLAAKSEWSDLRDRELPDPGPADGIPGDRVTVDGRPFHVHGITHADTEAEGEFLRTHVSERIAEGAAVYCEEGLRRMYFSALPEVREMDDYHWALERCEELDADSHVDLPDSGLEGLAEEVGSLAARLREATFELIDSGAAYGEGFRQALGDVASSFLTSHEDLGAGRGFEAFVRSRAAAEDPGQLPALQRYYATAFLPQPLEREWLRRHDPELELLTHARNERMADYVMYHVEDAPAVHLIVGAAHGPGVCYYLEAYRDGERRLGDFQPVG
ncbi:MAG: hypothetical protein ABEI39_04990 [Halobacteriales archaeon]